MSIEEELNILILEGNKADIKSNETELRKAGFRFTTTEVAKETDFTEMIENQNFDIVLADYSLPEYDGVSALKAFRKKCPRTPFIFVSGDIRELAVQAIKHGATDYIFKDKVNQLPHAVERALKEKKAEDKLRRLKTTLDATLDCIFIFSTKGFRFSYVNQGAVSQVGYTRDELLKMTPPELMPDIDKKSFYNLVEPMLNGVRETTLFETTLCHKNGAMIPVEIFLQLIAPTDEHPRFVAVVRDIADRRQAEKERADLQLQLQRAQRMEALGTLAGGIAHDFNNILTIIDGYSEIALMHQLPESHPARHSLEEILSATHRAAELVQQILDFSRQKEHEMLEIRVTPIVKETIKLIRASLPATIEIVHKIRAASDTIMGDAGRIHQVLMNLCTNAAHAIGKEVGILEICVTDVNTDVSYPDLEPGHYLKLIVSDTGHGMKPSVAEHIFEPYFTTKPVGEGTGLGLAVTHGIVTSFGGTIRVNSEPGKGSTFEVFFPIVESMTEPKTSVALSIPKGTEHILFVDDERSIAEMEKLMLEGLGYRVSVKTDSVDALEAFRLHPEAYDLVITDMTMPILTGDKLARELMRIRPDIPVILCTGYNKQITEEKAKRLGIREFFRKPVPMKDIARAIRRVLEGTPEEP